MGAPGMIALIWIDWYPYHHARLRALTRHPHIGAGVAGIEMVGKSGVHKGLTFREDAEPELPLHTLLPARDWNLFTQGPLAFAVWKKLSAVNPRTVFVPGYYTAPAFAAAIWARVHRRKTVLMTESTQQDHRRRWWKESVKSFLVRRLFDYAIAGGKPHVRYLRALGFSEQRIRMNYDVVDNKFFSEASAARRQAGTYNRSPYFLYVGRLAEEKNVSGLIGCYALYRLAGGSWPLVIVGAGPLGQELKTQASFTGFGQDIRFAGMKSSRELPEYYASAGCFILPSMREPWGLVVNEAMASGLPVIVSSRCGCVEDLVEDGANGFVFDPAVSGELTERMMAMETLPAADRERMGQRSSEIVSRFSPDGWAEQVLQISSAA
jgi:glycosyltransferase involved in cell wall biosynthesis